MSCYPLLQFGQFRHLCSRASIPTGHIKITVSRTSVFEDSFNQILNIPPQDLKRRLFISFRLAQIHDNGDLFQTFSLENGICPDCYWAIVEQFLYPIRSVKSRCTVNFLWSSLNTFNLIASIDIYKTQKLQSWFSIDQLQEYILIWGGDVPGTISFQAMINHPFEKCFSAHAFIIMWYESWNALWIWQEPVGGGRWVECTICTSVCK